MMISRRGRQPDPPDLRSLLVHRLSGAVKAIVRRSLRNPDHLGVFCEGCDEWSVPTFAGTPEDFTCEGCQRHYQIEMVIYREIDEL